MTTNPSYSSIPSAGSLPFPFEGNDNNRVKEVMVDTRINKVLALRTDSVAMLEALNSISEFYSTNTVEARRALRYNLETYNVENGKKFLQELTFIKQQLDETENLSNELNNICSLLKLKVEKADSNMKNFIDKTSSLEKNKSQLMQGKEQIEYFLLKFHMNDEDIHFLNSANLNHSNEFTIFFTKLMKLKDSFHECQKLAEQQQLQQQQQQQQYSVNSPSSSGPISPLAFELLEVLGTQKENAYHYLFQWIKEKCELFSEHHHHASSSSSSSTGNMNQVMNLIALEENNDLMHKLQISIAHIKDIPIYFQQCQDLLIPAKRNILMNRFMIALTQGESNNNNNSSGPSHSHSSSSNSSGDRMKTALDLQSHDPMLYVGSILAWMHQAVAAEREYIEAIYNDHYHHPQPISRSNTGSTASNLSTKVNESHQFDILARIVQTVAKPLRIRILQTLENHNSIDILYGLADLLLFYETIFLKLLSIENAIHACIKGCLNECKNLFRQAMKKQIDYLTNTTNQSLLSPNPLLGGVSNVSTSSSSSYLELKVSSTTREYSKLISNILKICCSSLSNLPFLTHFPTSAEIIGLASASSTPRVGNAASTSTSVPPAGAADTSLTNTNYFQMDVVLGDLIQPLLQYCRIQVSKLPSAEMAIYMLNNIGFLQTEISDYTNKLKRTVLKNALASSSAGSNNSYTIQWESLLVEECKIWKNILIHEEISIILKKSEMDQLIEKIDLLPPLALLSSLFTNASPSSSPSEILLGLSSMQLENIIKSFYSILFTISLSSELEKLMNPMLREEIRLEIAKSISDSYSKVYRFISDERNRLDSAILVHSIDQVNVLLGNNPASEASSSSNLLVENLNLLNSLQAK